MYSPRPAQAAEVAATLPDSLRHARSARGATARLAYRAIVFAVVIIPLVATILAI
jgi:hypothetical protein